VVEEVEEAECRKFGVLVQEFGEFHDEETGFGVAPRLVVQSAVVSHLFARSLEFVRRS
jgi:hypothetical protein